MAVSQNHHGAAKTKETLHGSGNLQWILKTSPQSWQKIFKKNLKIVFTFSIVALLYNIYFRESTKASGFIPQPALKQMAVTINIAAVILKRYYSSNS